MLCSTILCLSTRYNSLPGPGGYSRGFLIHERVWDYLQHIILRVMLGQEKSPKAKTRTLGTIESLLLLTEWHPRALHFPPQHDGWDSDLVLAASEDDSQDVQEQESRERWLEDVINPVKRSDRMSWMLVGCALSLAQELAVFDENVDDGKRRDLDIESSGCPEQQSVEYLECEQRYRLRKLLYLYVEQLSSRLGCKSIMHQSLSQSVGPASSPTNWTFRSSDRWQSFVAAWIELTKLVKSVSDTLFSSPKFTKHLLQNARYINLIEHFQPLLTSFKQRHLVLSNVRDHYHEILSIEYHYARIYTNSVGLQAAVERIASQEASGQGLPPNHIDPLDYAFIQEVIDGSLEILQIAIRLAETKTLIFSPIRIFFRITTASIFLLKGLSLGVGATKLRQSLNTLNQAIAALRSGALDDVHLGSRYATLLEIHVAQLQKNFIPSARPPNFPTTAPSVTDNGSAGDGLMDVDRTRDDGLSLDGVDIPEGSEGIEDWLTLPFDPSIVPFVPGENQSMSWLADGTLDFIWALEP